MEQALREILQFLKPLGGSKYLGVLQGVIPMRQKVVVVEVVVVVVIIIVVVICDFDEVSRFDCIPINIMILAYKKAGVPSRVTSLLGKALVRWRYHPTTMYRPSPKANWYTMDSPICGSGQGALDGTAGWTSVCDILLRAYIILCE